MVEASVLIVDDDKSVGKALKIVLEDEVRNVRYISNPNLIPEAIKECEFDVVLLDMNFGAGKQNGNEGLFWLDSIRKMNQTIQVVLITAFGDYELVVEGVKRSAFDFLTKPWSNEKLITTVLAAIRHRCSLKNNRRLKDRQQFLQSELLGGSWFVFGKSPKMLTIGNTINKVAPSDANILIMGENGTGKGLVAREIHAKSDRSDNVFINVDLGSFSDSLFESELFGHDVGAFTDAKCDKPGRFELADGGTIFLDEIGNIPLSLQQKLLSVIQNREVFRIGSSKPITIDVRIIAATNRQLRKEVDNGGFREDLFYRINTIQIDLPALRERKEDILQLAEFFLMRFAKKYNKPGTRLTSEAIKKLSEYTWPGNIRELENAIEKAVILSEDKDIRVDSFHLQDKDVKNSEKWPLKFEDIEKQAIIRAIENNGGKLIDAAAELGLTRQTIYNKCKKYEI